MKSKKRLVALIFSEDSPNTYKNKCAVRQNNYYPFGLKHKGYNTNINGVNHKYGFVSFEEQDELGLDWHDFGARNYNATLGRWMSLDPLAELDYNWTPYRYGYNSPLMYVDPDGLWEFRITGNKEDGWSVFLQAEDGDNLETLSSQTGLSEEELSEFYDEETIENLKSGKTKELKTFGGHLKTISNLLNRTGKELRCNCFGGSLEFSATFNVKKNKDLKSPINADARLKKDWTQTNSGSFGDIIRYAREDGYSSIESEETIKLMRLGRKGTDTGGAAHFAIFLINNGKITQILTKNGPGADVKWQIKFMDDEDMERLYGTPTGIGGGSGIYTHTPKKKGGSKKSKTKN